MPDTLDMTLAAVYVTHRVVGTVLSGKICQTHCVQHPAAGTRNAAAHTSSIDGSAPLIVHVQNTSSAGGWSAAASMQWECSKLAPDDAK